MATYDHNPNQAPATPDEWAPVLNGDIFCSPRCGGGCTKAEYDAAVTAADALAAKLGPGWEPDIWENLGWHYAVRRGDSEVFHDDIGRYTAIIRIDEKIEISESDPDPRKAIGRAIVILKGLHTKVARAMASLALDPLEISDSTCSVDG